MERPQTNTNGQRGIRGTPDTNMAMYWEGDILWLTPTDVTALTGRFISNTSRKITPAGLLNSSVVFLPKGSLAVCTRATIGALAISTSEICTNQGFKNIIPNEGFNIEFIYYLLQMNTNEMIKKIIRLNIFRTFQERF
ncbi:restriction endonuclease subunit S [Klebsiella pneumoniae]